MGKKLVRRQGLAGFLLVALCISCQKQVQRAQVATEPKIRATVVTIQTTLQPGNRTLSHDIVIADGKARSTNEIDVWRLVDLNKNNVIFVDDIAKTYHTESIQSLVTRRRAALSQPIDEHTPRVELTPTGEQRVIQGVQTTRSTIRTGAYQRELWVGLHPSLPANLYAVLHATDVVTSPLAPMMRAVDDAILNMRGFPLLDHAELPYGKTVMVSDRAVVKIESREVAKSLLDIPRNYKDVTARGASRRPVSSPPRSRSTPAAGSQSSSTTRRTP